MKIEIDLDEEKIYKMVVEQLFVHARYELGRKIEEALKDEILVALRVEVRALAKDKLPFIKLSDGRTIEQYVNDALLKKGEPHSYFNKSRISQILDSEISEHARSIFQSMAEPHIKELKEGILKNVADQLLTKIKDA